MGKPKVHILNPGGLIEVRFLGPCNWSLFSANAELIAATLARPEVADCSAYQTLNLLAPDSPEAHGAVRDVLFRARKGQLTADTDIARRRFILFDSDSVKPTGAAATDTQRDAAHKQSLTLEEALTAEGWPRPLVFDSGNGAHRIYAVDLPNDRETAFMLSNLLRVAARKFDTDTVKLDKTVWNAARITRLYGTHNQKAGRDSAVLYIPEPVVPVTLEEIRSLVQKWRGGLGYTKPLTQRKGGWTPERMEAFLDFHDIAYAGPVEKNGGLLWILEECPFNADHSGSSVAVLITKAGFPKFKCLHNGCAEITNAPWRRFVALLNILNRKVFLWQTQKKSASESSPS